MGGLVVHYAPIFLALAVQTVVIIWRFAAMETKVETLWRQFLESKRGIR